MGKQKFYRYNKQTLRYEEIKETLLKRVAKFGLIVTTAGVYAWGLWSFATPDSFKNYLQEKEVLNAQIASTNAKLDQMVGQLSHLKEKDNNLYSTTLEIDKIDNSTWDGGIGGSVKNSELKRLSDSKELIAIAHKMQKIKHQMTVVAESQDEMITKVSKEEKRMRAIPAIRPLHRLTKSIARSSGFGMRRDPVNKSVWQMHPGIDMGAPMGAPIFATGDGEVVRVQKKRSGYGFNVVVSHGYGYKTLYAHMSIIDAKIGQKVKRGEVIGYVGSTGYSTCPHVHYEVFFNNKRINPAPFIADMTVDEFKELAKTVDAEVEFKNKRRYGRRR